MIRTIRTCDTCKFGGKSRELRLEVGGEAVPDLVSVALGYEEGYGAAVLFATSVEKPKRKIFIAEVDGDYALADAQTEQVDERTKACTGRTGFLRKSGAGLVEIREVTPKNGMEGFVFPRIVT